MFNPKPKMRLKNWPAMVPVRAITANPRLERDPLANKSARVLPRAKRAQDSKVLFISFVIEKYLKLSYI